MNAMVGNINIRQDARRAMVGKMWTILGLMVLYALVSYFVTYLFSLILGPTVSDYGSIETLNEFYRSMGMDGFVQTPPDVIPFKAYISSLFNLIVSLALLPAEFGIMYYALDVTRGTLGNKSAFDYLLDPYKKIKRVLQLILATVLMGVFCALWALLLIVPGIIKALSYSQYIYVLYDNPDMEAMDALKESEKMMKGHRTQMFLMVLHIFGLIILSAFTMFIALIWIIPYINLIAGRFYDAVKEAYYGKPEDPADEFVAEEVDTEAEETVFTEL